MTELTTSTPSTGILNVGKANRDVGFALGVVAILAMLFIPMQPAILDFGLAASLSLAVLILMVSLWITQPLEFNSFPTLLLIITMFRLSLNVSSTRLILSEGHSGTHAAGNVIEGFSRFVVGGDFVIGIVIFSILIIINFIVITKGSSRIAEVTARFSLDAMPGKQMAIDADFGAGIIDENEAGERRRVLEEESAFFGAMDGASKFVRGDAIAGLIITFINIIGGILIGIINHDLTFVQAMGNYTVLTIGDGLVTQIPALVVSLSAGILVTKGGTRGAANEAVLAQLINFPKALFVAGGLSMGVGLLPGFPFFVFSGLAAGLAGLGYFVERRHQMEPDIKDEAKAAESDAAKENNIAEMLRLDDMRLDLGSALVPLIASVDAVLPAKVQSLRGFFIREFGFVLPPVRIKDLPELAANTYVITVQGVETARGEVRPNSMMVISPGGQDIAIPGIKTREPTFGLDAVWIDSSRTAEAEAVGLTVVDPESVITTHLTETIKEHMPELLTYGATKELIEGLPNTYQKLAADISVPSPAALVQHVLQNLLSERVSIRNLSKIIEIIADVATTSTNVSVVTEQVRGKLAKQICHNLADQSGLVPVMVLDQTWDRELSSAIHHSGNETQFIMSPTRVQEFVLAVRQVIQGFSGSDHWPALLVSPEVRPFVRSMLERVCPMTRIISHNEIHRSASVKTVATVSA